MAVITELYSSILINEAMGFSAALLSTLSAKLCGISFASSAKR
jgi:hypothetical protein